MCQRFFLIACGTYINNAGAYTDNFTSANGCDSTWTTLNVLPTYSFSQTVSICANDSFLLPGGTYVNTAGSYTDNFTSANGCDSTWTTTLNVLPTYSFSQMVNICANESFLLPGGTYTNQAGRYIDTLVSSAGCDSIWISTINVNELSYGSIQISKCEGESVIFNNVSYFEPGIYYETLQGSNSCDSILSIELIELKKSYSYLDTTICPESEFIFLNENLSNLFEATITLTNQAGCDSIIQISISYYSSPFVEASEDLSVRPNEAFTLEAIDFSSPYEQISWYSEDLVLCNNCLNISSSIVENKEFSVEIIDTNKCVYSDKVLVKIDDACPNDGLLVPNMMTPNGDGHNDHFYIKNTNELDIEYYRIFNRWGELVFETYDGTAKWDGSFRNQVCNPGVYVYYVQADCYNNNTFLKTGNITILK
ncbi:MAG: gliding motility-associated C-terminal domain-containing protein [Chitinophagales bacterium]